MSKPAIDLEQLVNRRQQLAYEHHLARSTYAYGVDLRRSAWLDSSSVGDPVMRTVDRRWNDLTTALSADALVPATGAKATTLSNRVMDELLRLVRMLHGPWPSVRVLAPAVADSWPIVTPLGTTKGGSHWLIVDAERLERLPESECSFLLACGLAHLQCNHGPLFAAHLMANRGARAEGLARTLLRPWSRVATFSADRAGLLAVGELDVALEALRAHADPAVGWLPPVSDLTERVRALEDFSKSRLMTRLRLSGDPDEWSLAPRLTPAPPPGTEDATTPTPKDGKADAEPPATQPAAESESPKKDSAQDAPTADDAIAEAEAEGERMAAEEEAADAKRDRDEDRMAEMLAKQKALAEAWPLARCDQRLTRRLGLL